MSGRLWDRAATQPGLLTSGLKRLKAPWCLFGGVGVWVVGLKTLLFQQLSLAFDDMMTGLWWAFWKIKISPTGFLILL